MTVPELAPENSIDDIESIDTDLSVLVNKFIAPIDRIRSKARPSTSPPGNKSNNSITESIKNDFRDLQIDTLRPLESRTHAFYRMIGLPVVGSGSSFYNPGFDPSGAKTSEKRQTINTNYANNFKNLVNLIQVREKKAQERKAIFIRQDLAASVYALLLRYPLPFNVLSADKTSLETDQQTFTINDRELETFIFAADNSVFSDQILAAGERFKTVQKILRPFIVDPRIENTVTPDSNKVCVPFLKDKKSTKIDSINFCPRPGLELIMRQRLAAPGEDVNFLKDVENIISETKSPGVQTTSLERQAILDTLTALSDANKINSDTRDIFTGITSLQVTTINGLIKTIKSVIKHLARSIATIDEAKMKISWIPIPSAEDGPSSGPLGASLSRAGLKNSSSDLDLIITELNIKKLNAERRAQSLEDLGDFASPFTSNSNLESVKKYSDQLDELVQKRDRIANEAFIAMGDIENITGEIGGLGLIDILAIYTALWSLDTATLINLLDTTSFKRMYNFNSEFRGDPDVAARFAQDGNNTIDIATVLDILENKISNVLSFADKLLAAQLQSPLEGSLGSAE